jgi:hypothetical protein
MTIEISTTRYEITPEFCCAPCARELRAGTTGYTMRRDNEPLPDPNSVVLCRRCGVRAIGAEPPAWPA